MTDPKFLFTDHGPMLEDASPDVLRTLLNEFDDEVRSAGVDLDEWVAPGIPGDLTQRTLASLGLRMPSEVGVWFAWHNGLNADAASGSPYPNFTIASLEAAVRRYGASRDLVPPTAPSDPLAEVFEFGVGPGWLRLVPSNYGLAIDCSTDEDHPKIRNAENDFFFEPARYRARSLCTFVAWRIFGIRNGGYCWDGQAWVTNGALLHPTQVAAGFS